MPSIFTRIIQGEIPCHRLLEDDQHLAFLDIRPMATGHALAIPKVEIDYIFDLSDEQLGSLMAFSRRVARGIEAVVPCERVGIMVAGLEVPHAHVHLVPIRGIGDLNFANSSPADADALAALAEQIRQQFTD